MFGESSNLALPQSDVVLVPLEDKIWYAFKCPPFSTQLWLSSLISVMQHYYFIIHLLAYSSDSFMCS